MADDEKHIRGRDAARMAVKTTNAGLSPSSPRPAAQSMLFLNPMSPLKPTLTLGQPHRAY